MKISFWEALGMRLRRTPVGLMRRALALAEAEGHDVALVDLEAHFLANGDPIRVLKGMTEASRLGIDPSFQRFAVVDLTGRDPVAAARRAAEVGWDTYLREQGAG